MANLQLRLRKFTAVKNHHSEQENSFSAWCSRLIKMSVAVLHRFWWHTKAYATILRLIPLVLGSLAFLYLYWCRKPLQATDRNAVENWESELGTQKWAASGKPGLSPTLKDLGSKELRLLR